MQQLYVLKDTAPYNPLFSVPTNHVSPVFASPRWWVQWRGRGSVPRHAGQDAACRTHCQPAPVRPTDVALAVQLPSEPRHQQHHDQQQVRVAHITVTVYISSPTTPPPTTGEGRTCYRHSLYLVTNNITTNNR